MHVKYTPGVVAAGDEVCACANNMRAIGNQMYARLRQIVGSEALSGEIGNALSASQERWNASCESFAGSEERFGGTTTESYHRMMGADARGAAEIAG